MKYLSFLIIINSIIIITSNEKLNYHCGTNNLKIKPKILKPKRVINTTDPSYKRRMEDLDEDGFKNFNIYVDKLNIEYDLKRFRMNEYHDIIINSLNKAAETLQKLLRVKPLDYGYQFEKEDFEEIGINKWDKEKFGEKAMSKNVDMLTLGIDLIIFATIEEMDDYTIAAATPIYMQPNNYQPIFGIIYINSNINFTKINIKHYMETTLIHEMTHVLGFSSTYFEYYFNNIFTKRDNNNILRTYINSPKVVETARKYFNCSYLDGVELENYGNDGTAGSHWEARILLGDYMNGVAYVDEVISEITLALLEDTGYYKPNYYTGGLMRYGKNKGCEFVFDKCVDTDTYTINSNFENEFFYDIYSVNYYDPSCSSARLSRTYNAWWEYEERIPWEYQYIPWEYYFGGYSAADYCPVAMSNYAEETDAYYVGSCSLPETGEYGTNLGFLDSDGNITIYTNKELADITGEEMSQESFCFLSSLIKSDITDAEYYSSSIRPICYKITCSGKSLTIKINNDYIVCPRAGGKIKVEGYKGYFLCPDYNLMCTGNVVCNDLFDCVEKKSEVKKESYIYDYDIKTSQNISRAEESEEDDVDNYELSDDGVCPKYCKHCKENKKCLKCIDDYYFLGNKNNDEILCEHKDKLSKGYYLNSNNNIYYKCMDYCKECSDSNSCTKCEEGIDYNYNKCININIDNCEQSDSQGICNKCKSNFAFNGTNINFCINQEKFDDYYFTKDNGASYYLCENEISNCDKCEYNTNEPNVRCNNCKKDYVLLEDEYKCLLEDEVFKNKMYYYIDDNKVKKCSEIIQNCLQCSSRTRCDKCLENFYFINDDKTKCVNQSDINPIKEYYLSKDKTTYLSCAYNNIFTNCQECYDENTCTRCKDGFLLIRLNSTCINGDYYYSFKISNLSLLYFIIFISFLL